MSNVVFHAPADDLDPHLTQIAEFHWRRGFDVRHRIATGQVFYCLSGAGRWAIDGTWSDFEAGSLFWNLPGRERAIRCRHHHARVLLLSFGGERAADSLHAAFGPASSGCAHPTEGPQLRELWQLVLNLADRRGAVDRHCCTRLALGVLTMAGNALRTPREIVPSRYRTYHEAKHLIDHHYLELTGIAEVARAVGITQAYLSRLFREHDNTTPHAYLTDLRMNHAVDRLEHSDHSVKQIAFELGFASAASFSKAFKRAMGVAPADYRHAATRSD